jgi:endonuclease/exonuclease/phosphatase family metal-dependent hydrolase
MNLSVATFNAENLFARYNFRENMDPLGAGGFTINDLAFEVSDEDSKKITARAIREVDADVICLQEIENLTVLERFNSRYLGMLKYKYRLLIDSHDPRQIDVAVLSRYPFSAIRTHRDERTPDNRNTWLFSRDCLEVEVNVNGKSLSLYVNHLKSMMGGREATQKRREEQAARVAAIIKEHWEDRGYAGNFIVLGDFNDYYDAGTSLKALLEHPHLENLVNRLPEAERWTHYYAGGDDYRQLDYLLPSKALAQANAGPPEVMRKGLPFRAERYEGERFPDVGEHHPKASDHAPLYWDFALI